MPFSFKKDILKRVLKKITKKNGLIMEYKPNYKDGSIVNLMTWLLNSYGINNSYESLSLLDKIDSSKYDNIVNFVIDGLGYNYLEKYGKNSLILNNTLGKMTSVFPTTTSAALTSFATGQAPLEHGITGWFMKLQAVNKKSIPSLVLPYTNRFDNEDLSKHGIIEKDVFKCSGSLREIPQGYVVLPKDALNTTYSLNMNHGATKFGYDSLNGFFSATESAIRDKGDVKYNKFGKYIFSYLPSFDSLFHKEGEKSENLLDLYKIINFELEKFLNNIKGTNTLVLLTADHGLLDTHKDKRINLNDYKHIQDTLEFPLCGEPRAAYCYVKEGKEKQFVEYIKNDFSDKCDLFTREDMVNKKLFGLFGNKADDFFTDRVGNYIMMMKKHWIMKDFLPIEKVKFHEADHGGLSYEELFIPLTVFEA